MHVEIPNVVRSHAINIQMEHSGVVLVAYLRVAPVVDARPSRNFSSLGSCVQRTRHSPRILPFESNVRAITSSLPPAIRDALLASTGARIWDWSSQVANGRFVEPKMVGSYI
jgi:hypothetical protein